MSERIFPELTNGPDRLRGGQNCLDVHDGDTVGKKDFCCCCDPCLHATQPAFSVPKCCRCVPGMICFSFALDEYADECCKDLTLFALAQFAGESNVTYFADFGDFTVALQVEQIDPEVKDSPCQWRLSSSALYEDVTYPVDHFVGDCFNLPPLVLEGVSVAGCSGSVSMSIYTPVKLPFVNDHPTDAVEIAIPYSPCNCGFAADRLCVGGQRHIDGPVEYVIFHWNEDLGDRWEYCPPGLTDAECNLAHLREIIYLRSDSYGNCYLELDFDQGGMDTNDWADPPNSFDFDNPHNIRDGMVEALNCGCSMIARTTSTDGRSIRIHTGNCGRWDYPCGNCRCVPHKLCLIGGYDGTMFRGVAVWDGSGWVYENGYLTFRLSLGKADTGDCVMNIESNYELPFLASESVNCGNFLLSENSTVFDPAQPAKHAFIWATGSACDNCEATPTCGPCKDRCGQSPTTLYLSLVEGIRDLDPGPPYLTPYECSLNVTLQFWSRGFTGVYCGYIGEAFYTCQGVLYRVVATMAPSPIFALQLKRYSTVDGSFLGATNYPHDLNSPDTYEPYSFHHVSNPSPGIGAYYTLDIIE